MKFLNKTAAAGILTGVIGLAVSFAGRGIIPGKVLGDPLPLVLSLGQLLRSLIYFNWRGPIFHLLFVILLGAASALVYRSMSSDGQAFVEGSKRAGHIAALINVVVVASFQVDALVVAFWYAAGGLFTVVISGWAAGKTAQLFIKPTA